MTQGAGLDDSQATLLGPTGFADLTEIPRNSQAPRLYVGPLDAPERYTLRELRSSGGEGELWLGTVRVSGHDLPVAIKILRELPARPLTTAAVKTSEQLELLRSIDHPNVVKVREAFVGPSPHAHGMADPNSRTLYSVMNYVDGEDLVKWVARNPNRSLADSINIVQCLAAALEYLHNGDGTDGTPVLHRDVKPANVIVTPNGKVRLVDFGMACLANNESVTVVGTPAYMAPELIAGNPASAASDRYGLGATAYFLITGVAPNAFDLANTRARLLAIPGVDDRIGFADALMTMLAADPGGRPTAMVDWATGLAAKAKTDQSDAQLADTAAPRSRAVSGTPVRSVVSGPTIVRDVATMDQTVVARVLPPVVPPTAPPMRVLPTAPPNPKPGAARRRRGFIAGVLAGLVIVGTGAFLAPRFVGSPDSPSSAPATTTASVDNPTSAAATYRACLWSPEGYSNVRATPESDAAVVRVLNNADCVLLTETQGQWHQLADGGWIQDSQLIADNEAVTNTANVAVRRTPDCNGEVVVRVSEGAILTVTGPGQGGWYPVSIGDYAGWSSAFHLRGPAVEILNHELCS